MAISAYHPWAFNLGAPACGEAYPVARLTACVQPDVYTKPRLGTDKRDEEADLWAIRVPARLVLPQVVAARLHGEH